MRRLQGWYAMASVAVVILAGCGSSGGTGADPGGPVSAANTDTVLKLPNLKGQTVVINTFGGSLGDAVVKTIAQPFEAATGAKVTVTTNCCTTLETQVKAHQFAGDLVLPQDYGVEQAWAAEGILKSDPRLAQIAKARGLSSDLYQANVITTFYDTDVLAWNTQTVKNPPTSWADFFNTSKFKGTRGLLPFPNADLEFAELGTGTPPAAVYPIHVNEAFAALSALRKHASVHFVKNGADLMNQLGSGQIDYAVAYGNRIASGIKAGLPVNMTFNQALNTPVGAAIPTTAKNVKGAVALVDFLMQPKVQAAYAEASGQAPSYAKAVRLVTPSMQKYMVTLPSNLSKTISIDSPWWQKNTNSVTAQFTKWLTRS